MPAAWMSRRAFLKRLRIGAGAITAVADGGLAWRVVDQSVLAPGTGPRVEGSIEDGRWSAIGGMADHLRRGVVAARIR